MSQLLRAFKFKRAAVFTIVCSALVLLPATTPAQDIKPLAPSADSIAAAGDTAGAVAMLEAAVKRDFHNAGAWHELGLLYWGQSRSARAPMFIGDQRVIKLLRGADSALRIATQLAPDSARYWLSLTDFTGESGLSTVLFTSRGQAKHAVTAAEAAGESALLARALHRVGMSSWRRYEPSRNRALLSMGGIGQNLRGNVSHTQIRDAFPAAYQILKPPTGFPDYYEASEAFRRALALEPTNTRYARAMYMALGDRGMWNELLALARQRVTSYPLDHQAQLARGIAAVRLHHGAEAQVAFDSALVLMDDTERRRITSVARVLTPSRNPFESNLAARDSGAYAKLDSLQRLSYDALFWFLQDPLISTEENEVRNEFLARVAWSDIRWTWEEMNVRGADTDFGNIHIRFGPPLAEFTAKDGGAAVKIGWLYGGDVLFLFDLMPSFLTAYIEQKGLVQEYIDNLPYSFSNVTSTRVIGTVPLTATRFRARGDSTDVAIAASIPVDSLLGDLAMDRTSIGVTMRVVDGRAATRMRDTSQIQVTSGKHDAMVNRSWTERIPAGTHVVQIEALHGDTRRTARTNQLLDTLGSSGFGMSDILVGTPPARARGSAPLSWRDVGTTPMAGTFSTPQVGLVWEVYELSPKDGQARYTVDIAVERAQKGIRGFAARVVDEVGRNIGREQRGTNHINIKFDRTAAASPRIVDYLTLNMRDTAPGEYRLRVTITDGVSGARTVRDSRFVLR